jgi:acyl transferase domain-containing protein/NAD(P)-dependent dehydrogenase (short-subunit alcohol dehydrogenase family)
MSNFNKLVYTPAGFEHVGLAISACRAGAVGIVNAELGADADLLGKQLDQMERLARKPYGVKLGLGAAALAPEVEARLSSTRLRWLIIDSQAVPQLSTLVAEARRAGVTVLAEVAVRPDDAPADCLGRVDGVVLKGNEAGGFVGEDASFILLQKWLGRTSLPLYLRGGLTPHVAAACSAAGMAGGVFDAQLLLLDESGLPDATRAALSNLSGSETVAVGDGEHGEYFRVLVRPGHTAARQFAVDGEGQRFDTLTELVNGKTGWADPARGLLPVGQDVCFAAAWRKQYGHLAAILKAVDDAVQDHLPQAVQGRAISENAPLAQALGLRFPLVQGPMTRVSDSAEFAQAIAEGGALPMIAFALLKGKPLETLLQDTRRLLGDKPWGIGLLGFAPQALLDEQLACAAHFKPDYAIIAGGRPDQAVRLEEAGIPTFLHVPAANLIPMFLQEGARRFIFEGRECGGHIGPLSSFVLWSTMVDRLLAELVTGKVPAGEIQLLFAGGIHDATSSAMVQVLVAPLTAKGVKVGILMGSAYLFTREIVDSGAIVQRFQQEVIECEKTVNLESGPGHASRCAYTPFAQEFFRKRHELRDNKVPADEGRKVLDDLIMGRLRIASKGRNREGLNGELKVLDEQRQHTEGMYMLGQVATLRDSVTRVDALHAEVTSAAHGLLAARLAQAEADAALHREQAGGPVDIAIVGISTVLPQANTTREYWENILEKVDAITEIPSHRWDWRLYFDADRHAKDKIYSKWGGFLDDLVFDPTRYGMPPKSIESVDPMQLMALDVARRTIEDAGYADKPLNRERASVIIGASGGTGDVGTQYGLRSELPRFSGQLPDSVADRLPEWTEDSFAGILVNVIAGRIANRLNFGGVNFTTDAACASSLAAVYQGVSELSAGRSDFVIAGGVDTVQGPFGYLCFSKTQALSPRGRCSTFDENGDGIVISEGIAMVALKRLSDAERDGDRIYAVIKGVGGSSDGNAKGMTAPLPAGQLRAMRRAYAQAGFGPTTVGLFEAHGTGTVAGDTAELESTTRLMREGGARAAQSVVGSVKTMIGHTKATAGVAGLVKAALALHHRVLPPHRNVERPNAVLRDESAPLYLLDDARPWLPDGDHKRRAAVSAFGFGGTNFHVVMEEYTDEYRPWLRQAPSRRWPAELLIWRESDRAALVERLQQAQAELTQGGIALRDLAASLAKALPKRGETLAIVAKDAADLQAKLAKALEFLSGQAKAVPPGVFHGAPTESAGKVALLFPGQGSQYPGMLRELAVHFDECAETLEAADGVLADAFGQRFGAGKRLSHFIFPRAAYDEASQDAARKALTSTDVAQPALGAVAAASLRLLQSLGVQADMAAGHSYGEFGALHAARAIDFDALMTLSAARGRFIIDAAQGADLGTMAAVQARREDVQAQIEGLDGVLVANHNAPTQSIISGSREAVQAACERLAKASIDVTPIPVAAAFHSPLVAPAKEPLAALIDATDWRAPTLPVYANLTGEPHPEDARASRALMAEHLVQPVEFVAEVEAMYRDGARVFVELAPKSVLTRLVGKILGERAHVAVALDDGSGIPGLLNALARLACAGVAIDFARLYRGRECRTASLDELGSLRKVESVPRTAWLLNGSGARRAAEPVRQIGITLEQAEAAASQAHAIERPAPAAPAAAALQAAAPARTAYPLTTPPNPVQRPLPNRWRKDRPMDDKRAGATAGDSALVSEYFETMRQFLETQERVMTMFMGGEMAPAARTVARIARPAAAVVLPRAAEPVAAPVRAATVVEAIVKAAPAPVAAAPAPAPAPKAPAPVAAPAPAPAVAAAPAPVAKPAEAGGTLPRDKMVDMLLGIVEEKTGYPRDMVGLDQNLEADLGIDSIKRIEVVGAMLQQLPETYRQKLGDKRSKLNTQPTLNGMLTMLTAAAEGAAVPFDVAETGSKAATPAPQADGHLSRHVLKAEAESVEPTVLRRLERGLFLVTEDVLGLAPELMRLLQAKGAGALLVPRAALEDEAGLLAWCEAHRAQIDTVAGVVHLAALGSPGVAADASVAVCRAEVQRHEKAFFLLLREFSPAMRDEAHAMVATLLGGQFARDAAANTELALQGGSVGMLKSLRNERPTLRVKAVDLDPSLAVETNAALLLGELEMVGGRIEVGYPQGRRTVFRTVLVPAKAEGRREERLHNAVILATGGSRGITAEVLREAALPGNVLILTGRSALPDAEPAELAALADADSLRQHFIAQVRAGTLKLKPADIQRKVQSVLAAREMLGNIADFQARGAKVEYHAVDVTAEADMKALFAGIYERHGRIDGIVHGAGVIEDKLLADKASDSWSRVVDTKVLGLMLLQRYVQPEQLRFFSVFSSVAGRYGNSGQSDYATANELMNRLCCQLQARWGQPVAVSALCWGPWGPTMFGAGMVTPETEAKFAARGVTLVSAAVGRQLFRDELVRGDNAQVEVICGEGPWEQQEVADGAVQTADVVSAADALGALLTRGSHAPQPMGDQVVSFVLDANHAYLDDHCIDGVPVLPAAAALEVIGEAVQALWPGWKVVEVRDHKLMKGVQLTEPGKRFSVVINPPPYGSSEGFEVTATLQSEQADGRALPHYRAVVRLQQQIETGFQRQPLGYDDKTLTVVKAYNDWLFHGPRFQVINNIKGLAPAGSSSMVRGTKPADWLRQVPAEHNRWVFDPALIDAAAQMAILWARAYRDETSLPTRFGRVVRFRDKFPERLQMEFELVPTSDASLVRANVYFTDAGGDVVMLIEEMDCVASAALNRLGGTAKVPLAITV